MKGLKLPKYLFNFIVGIIAIVLFFVLTFTGLFGWIAVANLVMGIINVVFSYFDITPKNVVK